MIWAKWVVFILLLVIIAFTLAVWLATRNWNSNSAQFVEKLMQRSAQSSVKTVDFKELENLPPPVVKYFRWALKDGQPMIRSALITWQGEFRMGKAENAWSPMTAVQHYTVQPPGFVWDARIQMLPRLNMAVRDIYMDGQGAILGKALSLVTMVDQKGPFPLAGAAFERYLGEAIWLPTALLPSAGVKWTPIDDNKALATIADQGESVSVEFHFDEQGRVTECYLPKRYRDTVDGQQRFAPWRARVGKYEEHVGMQVPGDGVAEWLFPEGVYPYWKGRVVKAEYEYVR